MPLLELPHTPNCLVCGRTNPHGLRLSLHVDPDTDTVTTPYTPTPDHIGFENIIHGGALATVLDEAMVWSAIWTARRACVAAEMTIRFRESARPGDTLLVTAKVDLHRTKLITTTGTITRPADETTIATATAKYIPLDAPRHQAFLATLIEEPPTTTAIQHLKSVAPR